MTNLNDFSVSKEAKSVLGRLCSIKVTGTYNIYVKKKKKGVLNIGKTINISGKNQTVYLIGVEQPVKEFQAQVIAAAVNNSDETDILWICAPEGSVYYEPRIAELLQKYINPERYKYICYYEKSCGAVMYTQSGGERKFILITNISGHIGFPKGHIERGENEKMTALREIYEETGVHTNIYDGFRESYNYLINGYIHKRAVYYLARFDEADVKMNIREISEYRILSFDEALKILNFKHDKDILEKANAFIDKLESGQ